MTAQRHILHIVPIQITRWNISLTWPRFIVDIYALFTVIFNSVYLDK